MRSMQCAFFVVASLMVTGLAVAQAPAGAPAGAMGICKDGTYSTQATKQGACRGHKGVQTWYSESAKPATMPSPTAASAPAMMPKAKPASTAAMPTPVTASTPAAMPAATPAPAPAAMNATASPKTSSAARGKLSAMQAAPGGGPGLVWVNTSSNVYHCQGTDFYGKTKAGSYMSEADAKAKGARADHGKGCS